nr:rRNA adenine N(6)-methyltransferase family protein [Jiangella gansuensis]
MPRHARNHSRTTSRGRGTKTAEPNHGGIHLLRDSSVSRRLVRSSGAGPGDLVVELGAGTGALTGPLASTGARVIAVERHPRFVAALQRRFADQPAVRVVAGDARTVMLPRRSFSVVANIPYAISTALLRRLLDPEDTSVVGADLLVQWGFAKRMTASHPRDLEVAWWQARFELSIAGRVRPASFDPAPSVDSAHLVVRRRADVSRRTARAARRLLQDRYRTPSRPAREVLAAHVPKKRAHRLLTSTGIDPPAAADTVPTGVWLDLAREVSAES